MLAKAKQKFDFSKPIEWKKVEDYQDEFLALSASPPIHSVVIKVWPEVAKHLLAESNDKNRRIREGHAAMMTEDIATGDFEVTGDTIKIDLDGNILDGQHRLLACSNGTKPLLSHWVFGLPRKVFDTLDRGSRRTAADALAQADFQSTALLAATISYLEKIRLSKRLEGGLTRKDTLTPRRVLELAKTDYADLPQFCADALRVNKAFAWPPSIVLAVMYLVSKSSKKLAHEFAAEWMHGPRVGRNKAFDVLNQRIMNIKQTSNGHVSRHMRAALLIITFNHWNAGVVPHPRAVAWKSKNLLPSIELDGEAFQANRNAAEQIGTSLAQVQTRVLDVLRPKAKGERAHMSWDALSKEAGVPVNQTRYVLRTLIDDGMLTSGTVLGRKDVTAYLSKEASGA